MAADYDGDGNSDAACSARRTGPWYIIGTTAGFIIQPFGQTGDVPTQSSYLY